MDDSTIWAAVLGWAAGSTFMWRYMLRVCDQEHAKVLALENEMLKAWDGDIFTQRLIESHMAGYRMGHESAMTDQNGEGESSD